MNQNIDRRRFCGITGLLALGSLAVSGCGEDVSTPKMIDAENPNEGPAKSSMDHYRDSMKKKGATKSK